MFKLILFISLFNFGFAQEGKNCTFDSDCASGYYCSGNSCVMGSWPSGGCTFDSDCLEGYYCNNKSCVMGSWPDGGCTFDSDCLQDYVCVNKSCVYDNDRNSLALFFNI